MTPRPKGTLEIPLGLRLFSNKPPNLHGEVTLFCNRTFDTSSRAVLKPQYVSDPSVQRPYRWLQLDSEAIEAAINVAWSGASAPTCVYYDFADLVKDRESKPRGRKQRTSNNWVLRWLMWYAYRCRDERKRWKERQGPRRRDSRRARLSGPLTKSSYEKREVPSQPSGSAQKSAIKPKRIKFKRSNGWSVATVSSMAAVLGDSQSSERPSTSTTTTTATTIIESSGNWVNTSIINCGLWRLIIASRAGETLKYIRHFGS